MPCPPFHQCFIVGSRMSYLPVYLRNVIVHPALACPQKHIGIQIIIILQAIRIAAQRVAFLIAIDAERTYSELHPRLQPANRLVYLLNEDIHIAAAPVRHIAETAAIACKARIIRKVLPFNGVRIEVIIHVNGIHIITRNNIGDHLTDMVAAFGQCRVKIQLIAVRHKPLRMRVINMDRRKFIFQRSLYAVRVNPSMKLHAALVTFLNHELHRIPVRLRHLPLHARQEAAPWLILRSIQCIRLRTHLKNNGIDACALQAVQLVYQSLLQLISGHATKLSVHSLYPCGAEFTFGMIGSRCLLCLYGQYLNAQQ